MMADNSLGDSLDWAEQKIAALQQQVKFLQNTQIRQELRGFSRTLCMQVERTQPGPTQRFFAKVYAGNVGERLQQIEQIYNQAALPTAHIVDMTYLPETDELVCAYEYLPGPTLKELMRNASVETCEQVGCQVGQTLQKFTQIKVDARQAEQDFVQQMADFWQNIFAQKMEYLQQNHMQDLPQINLHRLRKIANQLQQITQQTSPLFMHGDLNLSNVIISNGQPYLIDIADGAAGYQVLDFRGICWWSWAGNQVEKEQAIYRGIFRGMFDGQIPPEFHQALSFAVIYNLLWRVHKYRGLPAQTYYSFLRWHEILTRTRYFENYQFPWF